MLHEVNSLLEDVDGNPEYDQYLDDHISNVRKAFDWLKIHMPEALSEDNYFEEPIYYGELEDIIAQHDKSKFNRIPDADDYYELKIEYDAYNDYFYGEKTPEVEVAFDYAWLSHIHQNPHHWQHWVLISDEEGTKALDMPYVFIIEMLCDHWSFSWKTGNLYEIFKWYDEHKDTMKLSNKTKETYESLLEKIRMILDEQK